MHSIGRDDIWSPNKSIDISRSQLESILVHHANYTIGVNNKIEMMELIKNAKAPKDSKTPA
jgi:hypothetical protein